jgi:rhamnose utilization protein RhaD (predicted bifunctional aldolase and dehydrogenase)/NAD(P)-dependent dehydrogenase (short-subunit alcohol dehydrogenase family)
MQNRWNTQDAANHSSDLQLRVYSSRLLGSDPDLVLHGGGNTSVKTKVKTFLGTEEEILFVKGSGGDLATIGESGFSPVRLNTCLALGALPALSDTDMVRELRAAMLNPDAPTPSIEAIVHAIIPKKFVDHTHADAILAIVNQPDGRSLTEQLFGQRVVIIPYVMPGFILAKTIQELTAGVDWNSVEGLILLNHGIFTHGDTAQQSYERMIELVGIAAAHLEKSGASRAELPTAQAAPTWENALSVASLRRSASKARGRAMVALSDFSPLAAGYASQSHVAELANRGPLTPDHTIRTKRLPVVADLAAPAEAVENYVSAYSQYYTAHQKGETALDPAPRWAVLPGLGIAAFGDSFGAASIVRDIAQHTCATQMQAEKLGRWTALPAKDLFEIEYWELEQAKLKKQPAPLPLQGKVAIVSGAAAGIGRAIAQSLHAAGAIVYGLDLNPAISERLNAPGLKGLVVNLTDYELVKNTVQSIVLESGGLDILVSNAGIFTAGANFEDMDPGNWAKSLEVDLTSHMRLLQVCAPFLKLGIDPTAIFIGSRNVRAPGAGAGSYSCAKAAVTQLTRVAALELAPAGVRVNIVHPDAVFDTELWTPEALARSAERYGITVEEYKTRNLMKCEIKSADIGNMIIAMAGPAFAKTTGAQIPVDGGNDRTI